MPARHFTRSQKLRIINTISRSGAIALSCRQAGISRSTYYFWLSSLGVHAEGKGNLSRSGLPLRFKNNHRNISSDIARKIIKLALSEPDYSIRKIASALGVSTGYAWKKLKQKDLTTRLDRLRYRNLQGSSIYPEVNESTKFSVIYKYQNGLSVSHISRSTGFSRTTIYKWLNTYNKSKGEFSSLGSKRPKSESHWNYKKGIEQILLDIIKQQPDASLDALCEQINKYSSSTISRSGLYNILRRMKLNSIGNRVKYIAMQEEIGSQNIQMPIINNVDKTTQSRISYPNISPIISPGLLVYLSSVSLISVLILLSLVYIPSSSLPYQMDPFKRSEKAVSRRSVSNEAPSPLSAWQKLKPLYGKIEPDFKNGVFVSNTNKNIYTKGDTAKISFGVLDGSGTTICDSNIELDVVTPDNKKVSLSTGGGGIGRNPQCRGNSYVKDPDYSAEIKTEKAGIYKIRAISHTALTKRQAEDAFYVAPQVPFEIDRSGFPTRVYPVKEYKVSLNITPRQDFNGEISEELPSAFTVASASALTKTIENGNKILTWMVDWKKDNEYKLEYTIKFPPASPAVYTIEPLTITRGDYVVFEELKSWKISVDSIN